MQRSSKEKKSRFEIEKLEERISPIVHCITPLLDTPAPGASGGSAGGTAALSANGDGPITGCPPGENNPGTGA